MNQNERYEAIGVHDLNFHVTKSIDTCPRGLQQRELVKNGIEAELTPEENGQRRIVLRAIMVDGVRKLSVFNTGRGMTGEELRQATDLSSSIRKDHGLEGRKNRGEGAKVASLPWNHEGVRFRSCREGQVSETLLKRVGECYVRVRAEIETDDGESDYDSVWDATQEVLDEGGRVDIDWTEVVCLGQSPDQDTTKFPYGANTGGGTQREVLTEIFNRFYAIPDHVSLEADVSLHGRKGSSRLRLLSDGIAHWGGDHAKLRAERVELDDGVAIEFVYLPTLGGSNNVFGGHELAGQPSRAAIVWQGEMYDAKIGVDWKKIGAGYGLPYVHTNVTVLVHLPDDAPVKEGAYRLDLYWEEDGSRVEVENFQLQVREAMPPWLRAIVDDATRPKRASDMTSVRLELERLLKAALIKIGDHDQPGSKRPAEPKSGATLRLAEALEPSDDVNDELGEVEAPAPREAGPEPEMFIVDEDVPPDASPEPDPDAEPDVPRKPRTTSSEHRAPAPAKPVKKRRAVQLVSNAPEITWLDLPDQIESEGLVDRAAKYVRTTNVLYLNGLYDAVAGKISDLELHYRGGFDWEQVQDLVLEKVRADMALHIGSVVVHALAKQRVKSWDANDLEKALTPEALTVAADQSAHLVGELKTGLSKTGLFQAAKLLESA
ncbi:hypothetical protein [Caulobacter sp. Root1472]|uniref:hypothetical protein n=1 Tax=Caulobacter sp. Root1472 TaxID=1736470 RepID=UPI0006FB21C6|nr:hypothetical protein [Caulobacter sp. Root1472]KQZ22084.1 hypothetical protein ASD47_08160 [Caulobacter sp. Root1472]